MSGNPDEIGTVPRYEAIAAVAKLGNMTSATSLYLTQGTEKYGVRGCIQTFPDVSALSR